MLRAEQQTTTAASTTAMVTSRKDRKDRERFWRRVNDESSRRRLKSTRSLVVRYGIQYNTLQ